MSSELPATPGVSSRRSACDRCRGQKLRCLREQEQVDHDGRCDRCIKADAQCITSPIYHMHHAFAQGPQSDGPVSSKKRRRPEKSSESHPCLVQPFHEKPPAIVSTSIIPSHATTSSLSSHSNLPSLELFTPPSDTTNNNGRIASDNANVNSISSGFVPQVWNSMTDATIAPLGFLESGASTLDHTHVAKPGLSSQSMVSPPQLDTSTLLDQAEHLGYLNFGPVGLEPQSHSFEASNDDTNHSRSAIEELSKMNLNFVKQLRRMELPHVNMKTIIVPDCTETSDSMATPLDDILNSTRTYLDTLSFVAGAHQSPQSSASDAAKLSQHYSGYLGTSSSTSWAPYDTSSNTEPSSAPPSDPVPGKPPPDHSVLLLVLICYIHILRLHVALFSHIAEYVQFVSESEERTIIPLPSLCGFSNFPLSMVSPLLVYIMLVRANIGYRIWQSSSHHDHPACYQHV
jgi:hypothetical protein